MTAAVAVMWKGTQVSCPLRRLREPAGGAVQENARVGCFHFTVDLLVALFQKGDGCGNVLGAIRMTWTCFCGPVADNRKVRTAFSSWGLDLRMKLEVVVVFVISCTWRLLVNRTLGTGTFGRAVLMVLWSRRGVMGSGIGVPSLMLMRVLSCLLGETGGLVWV